ncbi:thioesterase family protein [Roseibium sp. RKSG952]|uniref:thioesterase family protein n=1 Tax=Roseibium sp. RKSG952 TaxID=2529384 RepID=UPI0012BD7DD7|nr:thioesterase family protein [Roseibium sp. RKSG952]MTI00218.1 thioesterase [Roseibium sp. RKSG952]
MTATSTLYSFVNRWECDENDHLNVQFYFLRFEEADRQLRLIAGLNETHVGARRVRHVRFHNELMDAQLAQVRSGIAFDGPHLFTIVHEMHDPTSGALAATSIDGYEPNTNSAKALRQRFTEFHVDMPEHAAPKGLPASLNSVRVTSAELASHGAFVSYRGTVLPRDIGPDGRADDAFAMAAFTNAAPYVWERTPLTQHYLGEHNLGRVVVEMKLSWQSPLKAGEPYHIMSGLTGCAGKAFSFRHHMFETRTDRPIACLDVVALAMDLKNRKAIALPKEAVEEIQRMKLP